MVVVMEQKRSGSGAGDEYLGQLKRISIHFNISREQAKTSKSVKGSQLVLGELLWVYPRKFSSR